MQSCLFWVAVGQLPLPLPQGLVFVQGSFLLSVLCQATYVSRLEGGERKGHGAAVQ